MTLRPRWCYLKDLDISITWFVLKGSFTCNYVTADSFSENLFYRQARMHLTNKQMRKCFQHSLIRTESIRLAFQKRMDSSIFIQTGVFYGGEYESSVLCPSPFFRRKIWGGIFLKKLSGLSPGEDDSVGPEIMILLQQPCCCHDSVNSFWHSTGKRYRRWTWLRVLSSCIISSFHCTQIYFLLTFVGPFSTID